MDPTVSSLGVSASRPGVGVDDDDDDVIEFRDVWKYFGKKAVLRGVTFKIKRGEAVGIIGPSGTGKSTALRLISGLIAPDRGEILVNGRPIADEQRILKQENHNHSDGDKKKKKKVNPVQLQLGLVFQNGALFDSLTVGENVGFRLYEHSSLNDEEIRTRVSENLAKVGLYGIEDRYPSELSGGMKKRVALARAITTELGSEKHKVGHASSSSGSSSASDEEEVEELVMYDEPTAGLDPVASTVVEDLIRSIHNVESGGVGTYIVVTHQGSTIARAVDRIIFLHEGRVVWQGDQDEFNNTKEAIVRQFASGSLEGPISYI
jgi:ABC-type transporter Mla maintaining outer membrane lipid asymmetry ATPase subunit MlaF